MPQRPEDDEPLRKKLARNVDALMKASAGTRLDLSSPQRMETETRRLFGEGNHIGHSQAHRARTGAQAVAVDVLEPLARAFDLAPWQLLTDLRAWNESGKLHVEATGWPFPAVERGRLDALGDRKLGRLEGELLRALDRLEQEGSPTRPVHVTENTEMAVATKRNRSQNGLPKDEVARRLVDAIVPASSTGGRNGRDKARGGARAKGGRRA
jgi:hypothetical protein